MPVDKGKFMWALREQDKVLDHAENLAKMLDMRHTKIPKELQDVFIDHVKIVMKTVKYELLLISLTSIILAFCTWIPQTSLASY